jgi:superfamily II DNA helicase RecQ
MWEYYDTLVTGPSIDYLISQGNLAPAITYGMPIDFNGVAIKNGEYDPEEQRQKIYSKPAVFTGFLDNWNRHAQGMKTLVFCSNVKASKQLRDQLVEAGIKAEHIDGGMSQAEKDTILSRFESGETTILTSIAMLTTGFDLPAIECIVLYRATRSLPLFLQMCGRGARPAHGKSQFIILDFGMNVGRFGFWQEPRIWTLNEKKSRKLSEPGLVPVKLCPRCEAMLRIGTTLCPFCGAVLSLTVKEDRFALLQKLDYKAMMKEVRGVQELELVRQAKGYKQGWLLRQFRNMEQFREYGDLKGYDKKWAYMVAKRYGKV